MLRIEFTRRMQETEIALIDQVGEGQPIPLVLTGHLHHKAQIPFHEFAQRLGISPLDTAPKGNFFCRRRHGFGAHLSQVSS